MICLFPPNLYVFDVWLSVIRLFMLMISICLVVLKGRDPNNFLMLDKAFNQQAGGSCGLWNITASQYSTNKGQDR